MRKIFKALSISIFMVLVFSMSACKGGPNDNQSSDNESNNNQSNDNTSAQDYTIFFENNSFGEEQQKISGVNSIPLNLPVLSDEDYEFVGWYLDASFTEEVIAGNAISSNITLYAKWNVKPGIFQYIKNDDYTVSISGYSGNKENVVIPKYMIIDDVGYTVTSIGSKAFKSNYDLISVKILDGVLYIEEFAFAGCTHLRSVEFPTTLLEIGFNAFASCFALDNVSFAEGSQLISIGEFAFAECFNLLSIEIPANVIRIGDYAFEGSCGITEVINKSLLDIVAGLKTYGSVGYYALQIIQDKSQSKLYIEGDYILYKESDDKISLIKYMGDDTNVNIPNNITSIHSSAFYSSLNVESIIISSSVENIGDSAFSRCRHLKSIEIPSSVTAIGKSAFYECNELTSIKIPSGIKKIEDSTFSNCNNLASVSFSYDSKLTSIGRMAFAECNNLMSIEIPAGVTSIGEFAFLNCYLLVDVINKSSLNIVIGSDSYGCLGYYALEILASKEESKIYIEDDFILYKESDDKITLVKYIGNDDQVIVPNSIICINSYSFHNCEKLAGIQIPLTVTTIGNCAFLRCSNLISVSYEGTSNDWDSIQIGYSNDDLIRAYEMSNSSSATLE